MEPSSFIGFYTMNNCIKTPETPKLNTLKNFRSCVNVTVKKIYSGADPREIYGRPTLVALFNQLHFKTNVTNNNHSRTPCDTPDKNINERPKVSAWLLNAPGRGVGSLNSIHPKRKKRSIASYIFSPWRWYSPHHYGASFFVGEPTTRN